MRIYRVPHNPEWRQEFRREAEQIMAVLGDGVVAVHHIGSTAIPGIHAKPVLDLLLVVRRHAELDEKQAQTEALGYEARGELGIPGRRFFRRDNAEGDRTHQVHAFEADSPQIDRHLAFRDYMIAYPDIARQYSDLKREPAAKHPSNIEAYMDGKDAFIQKIDRRAAAKSFA